VAGRLAARPTLLVLDNFEHLVAEGALTVRALLERVPALICLVTSRCPLGLEGEQEFFVPPLPVPPAAGVPGARGQVPEVASPGTWHLAPGSLLQNASVRLFVDRAQAVQPDFQLTSGNAEVVAEICRRLEGIPLALELAAARVRLVPPARMLEHLERRLDFLVTRRRDAAARHRTLRAAIDWSFRLLSVEQQRLFARLSVFRGGWTAESAEQVASLPAADAGAPGAEPATAAGAPASAVADLAALCDASVIVAEEAGDSLRYRMLDTLREHGQERVPVDEWSLLARRHGEYFLALAKQGDAALRGPEQVTWQDRLEREHDNFRVALAWSQAAPEGAELGMTLVGALAEFWRRRGHWQEARRWCEAALANPHAVGPSPGRAWALGAAAQFAWLRGDVAQSRAMMEEALAICRQVDDPQGLASATLHLGHLLADAGDGEGAVAQWREAERLFRDSGNLWGIALALNSVGAYAEMIGDEPTAAPLWNESAVLFRRLGDLQGIGWCLDREARVASRAGKLARARALLEEALAIRRTLGHPLDLCASLRRLSKLNETEGDLAGARRLCEEALAIYGELGATRYCRSVLKQLISLAEAEGDVERAGRYRAAREALAPNQGAGEGTRSHGRTLGD
jgi:non-specific serine/threonine protein kinase